MKIETGITTLRSKKRHQNQTRINIPSNREKMESKHRKKYDCVGSQSEMQEEGRSTKTRRYTTNVNTNRKVLPFNES